MTSIQANERICPTQPIEPGRVERNEFEYIRLGTQCLLAYWHIAKGQIITPSMPIIFSLAIGHLFYDRDHTSEYSISGRRHCFYWSLISAILH